MLFPYLIKVSFLLAILTLGYRWLVQFETFSKTNRLLLLFNLVVAWTLPLLPLPYWGPVKVQQQFHETVPAFMQKLTHSTKTTVFITPIQTSVSLPVRETTTGEVSHREVLTVNFILAIYLVGVLILASLLLFRISSLIRHLRKLPTQKTNGFTLIFDQDAMAPYSFFRSIVLNPLAYSQDELQHILAHEAEHARNWHSIDLLLVEVQKIALWFNPFAWYHSRLVQENLEFLADRAVLTIGFEKKPYQLNLLKIALNNTNLPLTNSFAQSLLKKRIKMMNRKPSSTWVLGKYTLLLVVLYLSSAFVAPYQQQILTMVPLEIKPAVLTLLKETPSTNGKKDSAKNKNQSALKVPEQLPTKPLTSSDNPWAIKRNDTLYWAISPLATWDDISKVREEVKKMGVELNINSIKFGQTQQFISSLGLNFKSSRGVGQVSQVQRVDPDAPIHGFIGYATRDDIAPGNGLPQLISNVKKDYQTAQNLYQERAAFYLLDKLSNELREKGSPFGTTTYPKEALEGQYANLVLKETGIGKSTANTLLVTEMNKNADFFIDTNSVTFDEINQLPLLNVKTIHVLKNMNSGKKSFIVFTR